MLGITFQGWEKLGWGKTWRERYMLLRDRIGVLTSILNAATLLIVMSVSEAIVSALIHHHAWNSDLGRYHLPGTLNVLIDINLLLLAHRIVQRALCVKEIARRRQMIMVPFRLVWGNVIDFYCTIHATRRYLHSRITGTPLKWLKTAHEFPNVEQLLRTHRPLGDLLLERRLITPAQLSDALATQRWQGSKRIPLGEILIAMPAITLEQLDETLALQARSKVRVQEAVEAVLAEEPIAARREESAIRVVVPSLVPSMVVADEQPMSATAVFGARPVAEVLDETADPIYAITSPPIDLAIPNPVGQLAAPPTSLQSPTLQEEFDSASWRDGVPAWLQIAPPAATPTPVVVALPPVALVEPPPVERPAARTPVIPINGFHSAPKQNTRRFSMLHDVASNWKTPFPSKRILVAIGTRPEAIKLAPVVRELQSRIGTRGGPTDILVCATGQHQEMVEEALAAFGVEVDVNLDVMTPDQSLAAVSSRVLSRFEQVITDFQPDWVVVQGDTSTTAMAGLAAFYAGVRVAHIEAGLRTHDLEQPFPEEFNRRMVGIFANIHFAATDWAKNNLLREGVAEEDIVVTGNTGIDALRTNCSRLGLKLERPRPQHSGPIRVLVTAHRRENLEDGIANICEAIAALVTKEPGKYVFLWPVHPNPRVHEIAKAYLWEHRDVILTAPAKYDELLGYLDKCDIVLTDSGGLQEEAPSFGKPVLIMRDKTERPEGVRAGMAWLVGTDRMRIQGAIEQLAEQIAEHRSLRTPHNPYGDGYASARIADFFAGKPIQEFGAFLERDEVPRRMPVAAHAAARYQTVS